MRRKQIIFWQTLPSPHQSAYLRALARMLKETRIVAVFDRDLDSTRRTLGWAAPDLSGVETIISPHSRAIEAIARQEPQGTVHLFSELRLGLVQYAYSASRKTSALIGLLSEARDVGGVAGHLRVAHSYFLERRFRDRIDFVLGIGHLGVNWYRSCGYPSERVFPWAYIVEQTNAVSEHADNCNDQGRPVSLCFVGQLIDRKGVDLLIKALAMLDIPATLSVVGDGPLRLSLERLCNRLRLASRVTFFGSLPNSEARKLMDSADLLVLPSRYDGWGAVINEALMSGIPAICSDNCGAADLVRSSVQLGAVFRAGSAIDLARVLGTWIRRGPLSERTRKIIRNWADCITGEAAARYLVEILGHIDDRTVRPVAPWLKAELHSLDGTAALA